MRLRSFSYFISVLLALGGYYARRNSAISLIEDLLGHLEVEVNGEESEPHRLPRIPFKRFPERNHVKPARRSTSDLFLAIPAPHSHTGRPYDEPPACCCRSGAIWQVPPESQNLVAH